MHFGFPYWHGRTVADPDLNPGGEQMTDFTRPEVELGAHVAALGMRFYTGEMFPERYQGGVFIAQHGSWNRSEKIGYRVAFVSPEDGKPGEIEVFAEGWLQRGNPWGRPVDVLVMPDGSLLVSDDHAGAIYRITYEG